PPEEKLRQLLRELAQRAQVLEPGLPPLRTATVQRGRSDLPEQGRVPLRRGLERAEMARAHAVGRQLRAQPGDLGVRLAIAPLPAHDRRVEQAEALEVAHQAGRDPGLRAELVERDLLLLGGERGALAAL